MEQGQVRFGEFSFFLVSRVSVVSAEIENENEKQQQKKKKRKEKKRK